MSDLRKQLDSAKDEYRSARYPGKLAEELLATPTRRSSLRLYIGAIGGLAAAAVVGFVLLRPASTIPTSTSNKPTMVAKLDHPATPTQSPTTAQTSDESAEDSMSLADLAAMPAFPDDVSISSTPAETSNAAATTMASNTKANNTSSDTEYLPMVPSPPSMTELGSMPSLPSMDFSFSDVSDTSSSNKS